MNVSGSIFIADKKNVPQSGQVTPKTGSVSTLSLSTHHPIGWMPGVQVVCANLLGGVRWERNEIRSASPDLRPSERPLALGGPLHVRLHSCGLPADDLSRHAHRDAGVGRTIRRRLRPSVVTAWCSHQTPLAAGVVRSPTGVRPPSVTIPSNDDLRPGMSVVCPYSNPDPGRRSSVGGSRLTLAVRFLPSLTDNPSLAKVVAAHRDNELATRLGNPVSPQVATIAG